MVYTGSVSRTQQAISAAAASAIMLAAGYVLIAGLDLTAVRKVSVAISAVALPAPPLPKPESIPPAERLDKPAGAAAPPNKVAKATPVAAPIPKILPITPPPVAASPTPGEGSEPSAGAAPVAGPGTGAGGKGVGTGAGGSGTGGGSGGSKAVWRSGRIKNSDYPRSASRDNIGGEVEVRFTIEATGRVTGCRVSRTSGDAALDSTTCRLIEERFRFKPATDASGKSIASPYGWRQRWWLEGARNNL